MTHRRFARSDPDAGDEFQHKKRVVTKASHDKALRIMRALYTAGHTGVRISDETETLDGGVCVTFDSLNSTVAPGPMARIERVFRCRLELAQNESAELRVFFQRPSSFSLVSLRGALVLLLMAVMFWSVFEATTACHK